MEIKCPNCGGDLVRDYEDYIWCARCKKRFILQGYKWPPYEIGQVDVYKYDGPPLPIMIYMECGSDELFVVYK